MQQAIVSYGIGDNEYTDRGTQQDDNKIGTTTKVGEGWREWGCRVT